MARAAPGRILAGLEHHGRPDRQEDHDHHRYESDVEQSRSAHAVPPLLASWPACCGYSSPESGVAAMKPPWWRCGARRVMAYLDGEGNVKATWKSCIPWEGWWRRVSDDREIVLPGGNVGGAVRIGNTVRRRTGPWTPAVHALLGHLAPRVPHVPRVMGLDDQGREVLSYLPGHVVDHGTGAGTLSVAQIISVVRWTRAFHDAVAGFSHPGPWRFFPVTSPSLIGHNDIAPYNV